MNVRLRGKKHKRTKATDISDQVKRAVYKRDDGLCIFCKRPGDPWCHLVPRSQGGLGIETNIVTLCPTCHSNMDNSTQSKTLRGMAEAYLRGHYPDWTKEAQIYQKYQ